MGLLESSGSFPEVPEPVKVAFRSFSDIKSPGTYVASDESMLLQATYTTSVNSNFNLTEWWNIAEGEKLSKPFDVGEELVAGVVHGLEVGSAFFHIYAPKSNRGTEARQCWALFQDL